MDKAAGVFALVLFAGYWSSSVRNIIASVENVVLEPLTDLVPFYGIVLLLGPSPAFTRRFCKPD